MVDRLLELGVIQPSKTTAWSQVHLVRKPNNGDWRFTIDYRSLNKVISNEGWQIPNMKEMRTRIGSKKPRRFGVANLTQGFYQIQLQYNSSGKSIYSTMMLSSNIYLAKKIFLLLTQMFCMTEKLLKSSIKQLLGVSPNTILYGDAILTEHICYTLLAEIDNTPSSTTPRTIRDYVDTMMARQGHIIKRHN